MGPRVQDRGHSTRAITNGQCLISILVHLSFLGVHICIHYGLLREFVPDGAMGMGIINASFITTHISCVLVGSIYPYSLIGSMLQCQLNVLICGNSIKILYHTIKVTQGQLRGVIYCFRCSHTGHFVVSL